MGVCNSWGYSPLAAIRSKHIQIIVCHVIIFYPIELILYYVRYNNNNNNNNNNNKPAWVKVQYPSELLSSSEILTMLGIYRWFCINCMRFLSTTGSSWGIIFFLKGSWLRRVWRYQRGNQNPYISKKNRQHNGQKKKYKRTNNDLQNIHIKLKIE